MLVVLIAVFFTARYFLRDRLPVRAGAGRAREVLINTVSTNGRVEPDRELPVLQPDHNHGEGSLWQEGDQVPAGKLLMRSTMCRRAPRSPAPRAA